MNRHFGLIFALLTAALSGCATSYTYAKGSAVDQTQMSSDLEDCRSVAERRTGNRQANEAINTCMEGKGYTVTKKDYSNIF
jgi:hypothetical protein